MYDDGALCIGFSMLAWNIRIKPNNVAHKSKSVDLVRLLFYPTHSIIWNAIGNDAVHIDPNIVINIYSFYESEYIAN